MHQALFKYIFCNLRGISRINYLHRFHKIPPGIKLGMFFFINLNMSCFCNLSNYQSCLQNMLGNLYCILRIFYLNYFRICRQGIFLCMQLYLNTLKVHIWYMYLLCFYIQGSFCHILSINWVIFWQIFRLDKFICKYLLLSISLQNMWCNYFFKFRYILNNL